MTQIYQDDLMKKRLNRLNDFDPATGCNHHIPVTTRYYEKKHCYGVNSICDRIRDISANYKKINNLFWWFVMYSILKNNGSSMGYVHDLVKYN